MDYGQSPLKVYAGAKGTVEYKERQYYYAKAFEQLPIE